VDPEYYLARVDWWPDGTVMAQIENREQTILELLRLNSETGDRCVLLTEVSSIWINIHDLLTHVSVRSDGFGFLWGSERSGFMHLYRYYVSTSSGDCNLLERVTPDGDWVVIGLDSVDETDGTLKVYFTANAGSFLTENLFVTVSGSNKMNQLTVTGGCHQCIVNAAVKTVVDITSSVSQPSVMRIYTISTDFSLVETPFLLDGSMFCLRYAGLKHALEPPTFDSFSVDDDGTILYSAAYRPNPDIFGPGPYPTIVSVYGGPHVQMVVDRWRLTADMRSQRMRQRGFLVLKCDNRGSFRRGIAFEGAIKHNMGSVEVQDQQALVSRYVDKGLADASRVGILGWSYGGYMSAMSLCRAPETFHCAIAGSIHICF